MLSFGIRIHEKKKEKKKERNTLVLDPTLEKEGGFQFRQTSQGMNGKNGVPGENPLVRCSANPMILILMRVSLPSKLRTTTTKERDMHTYTLTQLYMHIYILMQYCG